MSLISRFKEAFSKTVESVKEAFGGGDSDRPGSTRIPAGQSILTSGGSLLPPDSTFSDQAAVQSNLDAERRRATARRHEAIFLPKTATTTTTTEIRRLRLSRKK